MRERQVFEYYWLGTCVRYLQDAQAGRPLQYSGVVFNLQRFFEYLDDLDLVVTKAASGDLRQIQSQLLALPADMTELSPTGATALSNAMAALRLTLDAELSTLQAYALTPKSYDLKRLTSDTGMLFAPEVFGALPDIAKFDFAEAGRCTAFERPTAAAFHLLRGTESVLRAFYRAFVKQKRVKPLLWGPMVADLRKRAATKRFATLLSNLDNIRLSFRNPTQHPEMTYDVSQAQDLWGLTIEATNRMVKTAKDAGRSIP